MIRHNVVMSVKSNNGGARGYSYVKINREKKKIELIIYFNLLPVFHKEKWLLGLRVLGFDKQV